MNVDRSSSVISTSQGSLGTCKVNQLEWDLGTLSRTVARLQAAQHGTTNNVGAKREDDGAKRARTSDDVVAEHQTRPRDLHAFFQPPGSEDRPCSVVSPNVAPMTPPPDSEASDENSLELLIEDGVNVEIDS